MILDSFQPEVVPPEDQALREPVREFLARALKDVPASQRARSWSRSDPEFSRALARQGWVGLTLPKPYGGGGRSAFARFVVVEEILNAGAPVGAHWIADRQSGPLILKYGTEAQREFFLPKICRAEAFFCIGMSEPNSGSDLASIRTRAEKSGAGWVLNGQKIWTTNAHHAHYMIALVRTSGTNEDRQVGLSQFIIDLSLPGITIRPIPDLTGDHHFCEVFFEDVQLEAAALIGHEGEGWAQVTTELAYERSGPERLYSDAVLVDEWIALLREHGAKPSEQEVVGRIASRLAVLREMSVSLTGRISRGESPMVEAALVKDIGTELEQLIPVLIAGSIGSHPDRVLPADFGRTLAYVNQIAPTFSLRGGTREILRGMIARGLGLR
jgi:alkylation response protein AidB-like acyl-CoA dehydrogenase